MKKLNLYIIFLISLFFISTRSIYSQWTIAGNLTGLFGRATCSVVDGNTVFVTGGGTDINVTYKTTNGGTNWIQLNTNTFRPFWAICAKDANTVFAGDDARSGAGKFYKTTNGGINWTIIDSIPGLVSGLPGFRGIRFANLIPSFGIAYCEGNNGEFYVYKTRDGGNTWTKTLLPGFSGYSVTVGLNVIDSLFYAFGALGNPPSIIITTDGGVTWNLRDVNLPSANLGLTRGLAFKDKLTGIAGSSSLPIISRTTDGGLSWVSMDAGINIAGTTGPIMRWIEGTDICYSSATNAIDGGVLKSTNGGLNWTQMTTSGYGILYMDTKRIGSNIYGYANSCLNFGIVGDSLVLKITDVITEINQISELVPDGYSLSQNYPNPFNPTTNLEFGISKLGFVSLKIYNMLGKEVATLVNANLNAGGLSRPKKS